MHVYRQDLCGQYEISHKLLHRALLTLFHWKKNVCQSRASAMLGIHCLSAHTHKLVHMLTQYVNARDCFQEN